MLLAVSALHHKNPLVERFAEAATQTQQGNGVGLVLAVEPKVKIGARRDLLDSQRGLIEVGLCLGQLLQPDARATKHSQLAVGGHRPIGVAFIIGWPATAQESAGVTENQKGASSLKVTSR